MQVNLPLASSTLRDNQFPPTPPSVNSALKRYFGENSTAEVTHRQRHQERNKVSHTTTGLLVALFLQDAPDDMRAIGNHYFKEIFGCERIAVSRSLLHHQRPTGD